MGRCPRVPFQVNSLLGMRGMNPGEGLPWGRYGYILTTKSKQVIVPIGPDSSAWNQQSIGIVFQINEKSKDMGVNRKGKDRSLSFGS